MSEILLEEASLGYENHPVLKGLNLRIPAGEFVIIGGPNGGGKSTLLKSIVGLLPLVSGGREVTAVRFGYVPQQANTDTPLPVTALEMVELGAASQLPLWRTFGRMEREFYLECLHECRAEEFARQAFSRLSGGQRQRVLLARALAVRPNVLVLDEPTAGVDYETQGIIAQLLQRLNRENGVTVILVTHEPELFRPLSTRSIRVTQGRLESEALSKARTHESSAASKL